MAAAGRIGSWSTRKRQPRGLHPVWGRASQRGTGPFDTASGRLVKRDTLTVIDDRDPRNDSEHLQLANFSIVDDRETGQVEVYLIRLGERGGDDDVWTADACRYRLER